MSERNLHRTVYLDAEIKRAPAKQGIITGICSTKRQDRMGDVVEPGGMEVDTLPFALLLHHDHTAAIGSVTRVWRDGDKVRFEAKLARPEKDSSLSTRVAEAEGLLAAGVAGVSIGFRAIEREPLKGGGWRFTRWSIHEISLVSVPAHPEARVELVKSISGQPSLRLTAAERVDMELFKARCIREFGFDPAEGENG